MNYEFYPTVEQYMRVKYYREIAHVLQKIVKIFVR